MRAIRRASGARLSIIAAVVLLVGALAAVASAALRNSGSAPPDQPLAAAVHDAITAQAPAGVTARIAFTNNLLPSGALPQGSSSAMLTGATGRLWASNDGRFRLELQSQLGDTQVVSDGQGNLYAYDTSSNTVYRLAHQAQGSQSKDNGQGSSASKGVPTVAELQKHITDIAKVATLSNAIGDSIAGQGAYHVDATPTQSGGLLGKIQLAWDVANGVPLRFSIFARGDSTPVLELTATDISFGPVAASDVSFTPPAGAKTVDLQAPMASGKDNGQSKDQGSKAHDSGVSGVAAVKAAVPFPLSAPDTLVGLPRQDVRLISGDHPAALLVYGKGLGAIVVVERAAEANGSSTLPAGLPQVSINGSTGNELATALGTGVSFTRNGVSYLVAGSVLPVAAERAAREVAP
jgi:outer membrane lipoprotein-sorting protein